MLFNIQTIYKICMDTAIFSWSLSNNFPTLDILQFVRWVEFAKPLCVNLRKRQCFYVHFSIGMVIGYYFITLGHPPYLVNYFLARYWLLNRIFNQIKFSYIYSVSPKYFIVQYQLHTRTCTRVQYSFFIDYHKSNRAEG